MQRLKYKRLTNEQLEELENEFVNFLVVNGILAEDWAKMKKTNPDKAERMVELFSDVVFEGIMRKTNFIEWRGTKEIRTFHCLKEKIVLIGLKADASTPINFLNVEDIERAALNPPEGVKAYTTSKEYSKIREQEIFEMLENGCFISDGKLYKAIATCL